MNRYRLLLNFAVVVVALAAQFAVATASRPKATTETKFTVRVENISNADGQTASDGTKWPFALSPGVFVLDARKSPLFIEGKGASKGLESQAEDGNPSGLVNSLEMKHHSAALHGVFNTAVGMTTPGPIGPGGSYEFSFNARPGMKLSMAMMFGQSNDLFYAPDANGIALFDGNNMPIGGDVTDRMILWDAGTEVNQELGIGPDQGPRQKGPNMGATESGVVTRAKNVVFYTRNAELFRVTITPENGM